MVKKIMAVFAVAVAVMVTVMLWMDDKGQQKKEAQLQVLAEQAGLLEAEKQRLQNELGRLEREYEIRMKGMATEEILVTELDDILYTDMYPLMKEYDAFGILALSEKEFPGENGKITEKQFQKMMADGWSYCLAWDGTGRLADWLDRMKERLEGLKLKLPGAVYICNDAYTKEMDSVLLDYGITAAVCQWNGGAAEIVSGTGEDVWTLSSYPWNTSGVKSVIHELVRSKGNLTFTVSFTQQNDLYQREYYRNMLSFIADYRNTEELMVTDFAEARAIRQAADLTRRETQQELEEKREELQSRIAETDRQIRALYAK